MEKGLSRRDFLKRTVGGSLIIAAAPRVLQGNADNSVSIEYSALDLFRGKKEVIRKRIKYVREKLTSASDRQLDFAEMVSGNYPDESSRGLGKTERIEHIIQLGLEENNLATILSTWHPISHLEILGQPDFQNSQTRGYWTKKMNENNFPGRFKNVEDYVAFAAACEVEHIRYIERGIY